MNIYEKLSAITAELQTVQKNLNVATGGGRSYKAVAERDILDAVKPLENKYKVYSYPVARTTLETERLESTGYDGKTKTTFYCRIETVYRFVNTEKPDEYIETTVYSTGLDTGDKADGKAMTYGDKYALMKAYKISTGDDPDAEGSKDENYKQVGGTMISRAQIIAQMNELGIDIPQINKLISQKYAGKDCNTVSVEILQGLLTALKQKRGGVR